MHKLVALLLAIVGGFGVQPAFAHGEAGGADHVVMVLNYRDGMARSLSGVAVSPTASEVVDNENLAHAESRCSDCRTVAIAAQAVLITRDSSVVQPKNVAVAVNENCLRCETAALAYQYVVTTGGPVHLSAEGQQEIRRIRDELADLAASPLPFPDLEAQADGLYEQLRSVIDAELVRAGLQATGVTGKQVITDVD
ncbi:MAG TPA: hypothetical protein VG452_10285 [Egibacteraceae bacterium]|nr:hypothetical protein [Egibacteraceae bacterium]